MNRLGRSVSAVVLAVLFAAPGALFAGEEKLNVEDANTILSMMGAAKLTLKSAVATAEKETKGHSATVHATLPKGALQIEVTLLAEKKAWSVTIDKTGKITDKKEIEKANIDECEGLIAAMTDAKLPLPKAISIAEKASKGRALNAKADLKPAAEGEGKDVFVRVTLLVKDKLVTYIVGKDGKATEEANPNP